MDDLDKSRILITSPQPLCAFIFLNDEAVVDLEVGVTCKSVWKPSKQSNHPVNRNYVCVIFQVFRFSLNHSCSPVACYAQITSLLHLFSQFFVFFFFIFYFVNDCSLILSTPSHKSECTKKINAHSLTRFDCVNCVAKWGMKMCKHMNRNRGREEEKAFRRKSVEPFAAGKAK